jgi:WD40 repeat protein
MPSCPYSQQTERLSRLLADDLPESEQSRLTAHVERCPECRGTLDAMAARSGLWKELPLLRDDELDTPAIDAPKGAAIDPADDEEVPLGLLEPADEPGQLGKLGPYDILRVVGRGGMGVVFQARDRALDRLVAIKVLTPSLASTAAARRRFAREAKAAAAVVHDHVVTIHAVDATPQGIPYLVMNYIAGKSVQDLIDGGKPPELCEILRIGTQAAQALAAAHAQGLIHRDIKPANILLENGVERVKITDFGLARAADDATMTQSGVVAGTPRYMSPEQARGETIDHRSDLFSLGSVLYALCTCHPPFQGNSSLATLKRVCELKPEPIGRVNPDVPSWLVRIIERLHAKDPADRYGSAAEVADLLGRCLAHVQQPASVPLPHELARPQVRRRAAVWGTVVACLVLVALLGFSGVRAAAQQAVDYVATVLRLKTPEGVLVIEVSDPSVAVRLDGSDLEIKGAGVNELRLAVGAHRLQAVKDQKVLREELVTITRGGRTIVSVRREPEEQPPPTPATYSEIRSATDLALRALRGGGEVQGRGAVAMEPTPILRPGAPRRPGAHETESPMPLILLNAAGSEVRSVAFSPDGKLLAYGLNDGRLGIWDWQSMISSTTVPARHALFTAHPGGVESVAFSPDGRTLLSGGWDKHVKLWDLTANPALPRLLWEFAGHTDGVRSVAFGGFGRLVVSGGFDGIVTVLSAGTGQRDWTSPKLEQPVNGVQFSPSGHEIAMAMGDYSKGTPGDPVGQPGEVQLWSWPGRKRIATLHGWTRECKSVAFSPEGGLFAATGGDGTSRLYVYDADSCKEKSVLKSGPFTAGVAFRNDGRLLATSNWSGQVLLWDPATAQSRAGFEAHGENIPCVAFSPDGGYLATASADGSIKIWDVREPTILRDERRSSHDPAAEVRLLAGVLTSNAPRPGATPSKGTRLYMRDLVEGRTTMIADTSGIDLPFAEVPDWSHDGRRIVFRAKETADGPSRIIMLESRDGRPSFRDLGEGDCPRFSPDDHLIAFLLWSGTAEDPDGGIWLMNADGSDRRRIAKFGAPFWSPDGKQLLINGMFEPTESDVYDFATKGTTRITVSGQSIFSWPRWTGPDQLVACVGGGQAPESIVILDVSRPSNAKVVRTLWRRSEGPDVVVRWPLISPSSRDCFFIRDEGDKRTLYKLFPYAGRSRRLLALEVGGPKLSSLSLSPDARYLLFASDRVEPDAPILPSGRIGTNTAREVRRLAEALTRQPLRLPPWRSGSGERMQLYMRDLVEGTTHLIAEQVVPELTWCGSPNWSHDGKRIVFDTSPGTDWQRSRILTLEEYDGRPASSDLGPGNCPSFSPDDSEIAMLLNPGAVPGSEPGVWIMRADGSGRQRVSAEFGAPFWSPAGSQILINSFSEPTTSTVYDLVTKKSRTVTIPGYRIFSWPRWVSPGVLVASIGKGTSADAIALLELNNSYEANITRLDWRRSPALDVFPRWPLFSPETAVSYFVGVEAQKRTLFQVTGSSHGRLALPVEGVGQDDKLGGLALSPDGRYLLFNANRSKHSTRAY